MKLAVFKVAALAAAVMLAGCSQIRQHKGVVLDPQVATAIQPGVDNKDSVEKALGRASFVGQFTPNDWYYVSRDVNQVAFRNPKVTKQTVMIVRFDQKGNVASVQQTGRELVMNIGPYG
jgi:outer membrane protein assembly factor BamE (lipoprotein component of BamABCDE complex)